MTKHETGSARPADSRRRTRLVGVRLHPEEHALALQVAAAEGMTLPALIRAAFLAYVDRVEAERWAQLHLVADAVGRAAADYRRQHGHPPDLPLTAATDAMPADALEYLRLRLAPHHIDVQTVPPPAGLIYTDTVGPPGPADQLDPGRRSSWLLWAGDWVAERTEPIDLGGGST